MDESLERILKMVADGRLTPEDAEPLVAALTGGRPAEDAGHRADDARASGPQTGVPRGDRHVRLQILESGRSVVNLRLPLNVAALTGSLPGIAESHADRIREAIRSGVTGRILEIQDEDGDGVIISTE